MITKDLGAVTAYAEAVEGGYTGTEEEYAALLASYATVAQQAAASATAAAGSATSAAASATEASTTVSGAIASIEAAGDAQVDLVTAEGTTQIGLVSAEGAAQVSAVDAKGAEVIESIPEDYTELSADVTQLKIDFDELDSTIFQTEYPGTAINVISGITVLPGYNASPGTSAILVTKQNGFDTYYFITSEDVDIWVGNISSAYFAITVGGEFTSVTGSEAQYLINCGGTKTRYRTTDSNLPTVSNKLHVASGCPIVFTVTANGTETVYGVNEKTDVSDSFRNKIVNPKYCQYVSGSGSDASTEKLSIYIPNNPGYIRYDFLHTELSARNADIWRIGYAYYVDDDFNELYPLTTAGEWECAIKINGRSDYSGGYIHGDEICTGIVFLLNGSPVDITTLTVLTPFNELSIFETSGLYDPNDSTTLIAVHGSEHKFDNDGLTISQSVKFALELDIVSAYLAMFPIAKSVSNKVIPDNTFVPLDASSVGIFDTDSVTIYKTDGTVKAEFSVPVYEAFDGGKYAFWCLDNGTTEYNKCYYVCASASTTVQANKLVKTKTKYNFTITA